SLQSLHQSRWQTPTQSAKSVGSQRLNRADRIPRRCSPGWTRPLDATAVPTQTVRGPEIYGSAGAPSAPVRSPAGTPADPENSGPHSLLTTHLSPLTPAASVSCLAPSIYGAASFDQ